MPNNQNLTVAALVNDRKTFRPEVLTAVKAYARSKPWQGSVEERQNKLQTLHAELCRIYEKPIALRFMGIDSTRPMGGIAVRGRGENREIVLTGKISVVNYLFAFTDARGAGQRECFSWSINLFKRCFPRSFEAAEKVGPMLLAAGTTARMQPPAPPIGDELGSDDGEI